MCITSFVIFLINVAILFDLFCKNYGKLRKPENANKSEKIKQIRKNPTYHL